MYLSNKKFDADWFEQEELILGDCSMDGGGSSKNYEVDQQLGMIIRT